MINPLILQLGQLAATLRKSAESPAGMPGGGPGDVKGGGPPPDMGIKSNAPTMTRTNTIIGPGHQITPNYVMPRTPVPGQPPMNTNAAKGPGFGGARLDQQSAAAQQQSELLNRQVAALGARITPQQQAFATQQQALLQQLLQKAQAMRGQFSAGSVKGEGP